MQVMFFLISFFPYILIILLVYVVFNIVTNKTIFNKYSIIIILLILTITLTLIWYYFPNKNILCDVHKDSISVNIKDMSIEIKDEEKVEKLFKTINKYTYIRSAVKSLVLETFPYENLIRIDIYDFRKGKAKNIHLYIFSDFENKNTQTINSFTKENILQIDEQLYSIKDSKGLGIDIYELLKEFKVFDNKNE